MHPLVLEAINKGRLDILQPLSDYGILSKLKESVIDVCITCSIHATHQNKDPHRIAIFHLFWSYKYLITSEFPRFYGIVEILKVPTPIYKIVDNYLQWTSWSKIDMTRSINRWSPKVVRKAIQNCFIN